MALSDPSWKMLLLRLDLRRVGHTGVPRQDILDGCAQDGRPFGDGRGPVRGCGLPDFLASNRWLPARASRHHELVAHGRDTVALWRPAGPEELALVATSGWREGPRLPEQPIFYPVLNKDHAATIDRDWNVPCSGAGVRQQIPGLAVVLGQFPRPTCPP